MLETRFRPRWPRFFLFFCFIWSQELPGQITAQQAALYLTSKDGHPDLKLFQGCKSVSGPFGTALEFTSSLQYAEANWDSKTLDGIKAMSVGGWFFPFRSGEQSFFFRGIPEIDANGNRIFRPQDKWVNFLIGTDQHGFLLGAINGNGSMPFPHVTLNEVAFDSWNQIVLAKDAQGFTRFYLNGALIHTDTNSVYAGKTRPFKESDAGEPIRLAMPLGGRIGEAWLFTRELSPDEIRQDFLAKHANYKLALPGKPVLLREMDSHPMADLWPQAITNLLW